ncbi:hypothetical protein B0A66_08175 [Flavobacterium hercynium]|uniref:Uncharacterized protein n=2 Tax=Flavobacterium hercynium TaxID=387094 RepID=A0A226HFX0_9FLAO|nr:hypothetical protein B0A66_08175 [Flavobacterium hercynium]
MNRHSFKCLKLIEGINPNKKLIVMLKKFLSLEGMQRLSVSEQKNINGGAIPPDDGGANCNEFVIVTATEARCLAYDPFYRPVYIGSNKCSILMPPC